MNTVTILSDDAPLPYYYGHPKGVQGWEDLEGPPVDKDSKYQAKVRNLAGALVMDHKADKKKRRYVRLHGVPVAMIRYTDKWEILAGVRAKGVIKGEAKNMKECMAAIAAAL